MITIHTLQLFSVFKEKLQQQPLNNIGFYRRCGIRTWKRFLSINQFWFYFEFSSYQRDCLLLFQHTQQHTQQVLAEAPFEFHFSVALQSAGNHWKKDWHWFIFMKLRNKSVTLFRYLRFRQLALKFCHIFSLLVCSLNLSATLFIFSHFSYNKNTKCNLYFQKDTWIFESSRMR